MYFFFEREDKEKERDWVDKELWIEDISLIILLYHMTAFLPVTFHRQQGFSMGSKNSILISQRLGHL